MHKEDRLHKRRKQIAACVIRLSIIARPSKNAHCLARLSLWKQVRNGLINLKFKTTAPKGLRMNNMYILARAPGGQMQGGATQAMRCHRRGAPTQQMPARRRAPSGCGPQARRLRCSLLTCNPACSSLAPCRRAWGPAAKCTCYSCADPKRLWRLKSSSGAKRRGDINSDEGAMQ